MLENILTKSDDVLRFPHGLPIAGVATNDIGHIAVVGNFPPTKCGIATFTQDMVDSLAAVSPKTQLDIYAMVSEDACACPSMVKTIIPENDREAYREAGKEIERSKAEIVWLQHEFGLFGGEAGEWIIDMLRHVAAPLVVTLHTVLENPTPEQQRVMRWLSDRAARLVVMSDEGRAILERVYRVKPDRIAIIPHGVPDRPFGRSREMKQRLDLDDAPLLMTFGLISPGKGIETAIAALPAICAENPGVRYCIAGATHPKLLAFEGEAYREKLEQLARELGVEDNVLWINKYLDKEELLDRIEAADVYLTPYASADQSTSGTLSYALALGKAVVSTPYKHARELLADAKGELVPFADPAALGDAVNALLANPDRLAAMQLRAYEAGRATTWPEFARQTLRMCEQLRVRKFIKLPRHPLPENGLFRLTDNCGIIQHSVLSIPDRHHGYCVDDNARALMLAHRSEGRFAAMAGTFAAFVQHSWNPDARAFRNFMGYDRNWLEPSGSTDSNGRTLWAIGATLAEARDPAMRLWASRLWAEAAPIALDFTSPRAIAFAMLGADLALSADLENRHAKAILDYGLTFLWSAYKHYSRPGWRWFEPCLAYDNCRLPEAMLRGADRLGNDVAALQALEALDWIALLQTEAGHFRPVGSNAFGALDIAGDPFDQQPVDAWAMIDAALAAYRYEADSKWIDTAEAAYGWFHGQNDRGLPLAVTAIGDCYDGITPVGVNLNQGAESVLALHMGQASMQELRRLAESGELAVPVVTAATRTNAPQPLSV